LSAADALLVSALVRSASSVALEPSVLVEPSGKDMVKDTAADEFAVCSFRP